MSDKHPYGKPLGRGWYSELTDDKAEAEVTGEADCAACPCCTESECRWNDCPDPDCPCFEPSPSES